jgi:hypothetical protein
MLPLLDFSRLANLDAELAANRDSDQFFLKQQDIAVGQPLNMRLLPPKAAYGGLFYVAVKQWWLTINGKQVKIISPETFGEADVLKQYADHYRINGDASVKALLNNSKVINCQIVYLIPCLILDDVTYTNSQVTGFKIRSGKPCVFQCGAQILKQINGYFLNPQYATSDGMSICSIPYGRTLSISKDEVNKKIEYKVAPWAMGNAVSEEFADVPDVVFESVKRQAFSDPYMISLFNEFLTGRPTMAAPEYRFPDLRHNDGGGSDGAFVPTIPQTPVQPPLQAMASMAAPVAVQQPFATQPVAAPIVTVAPPPVAAPQAVQPTVIAAAVQTAVETVAPLVSPVVQQPVAAVAPVVPAPTPIAEPVMSIPMDAAAASMDALPQRTGSLLDLLKNQA